MTNGEVKMDSKYWADRGHVELTRVSTAEEGLSKREAEKIIRHAQRVRSRLQSKQSVALFAEGKPHVAGHLARRAAGNFKRSLLGR